MAFCRLTSLFDLLQLVLHRCLIEQVFQSQSGNGLDGLVLLLMLLIELKHERIQQFV